MCVCVKIGSLVLVKAYDDCVCVCVCRLLVLFNFFFPEKKVGTLFLGFFFLSLSFYRIPESKNSFSHFHICLSLLLYIFFHKFFSTIIIHVQLLFVPLFFFLFFPLYISIYPISLCRQICLSKILSCKLYTRIKYTNATKKKLWKKKI